MIKRKHDRQIDVFLQSPEEERTGFVNFGWEITKPGFQELTNRRNYVLIHFVTRGKGFLLVNGRNYPLNAGMLFVIFPNIPVSYGNTDPGDPMSFAWFGFRSSELTAAMSGIGLSPDHPVAAYERCDEIWDHLYNESIRLTRTGETGSVSTDGLLYSCFGKLLRYPGSGQEAAEPLLPADERIRSIVSYINNNFNRSINVSDLCEIYHFSHATLWRAFKKSMGVSPAEYITDIRLRRARKLLLSGMCVKDTAASVGWPDPYYFSHVFKRHTGLSPNRFVLLSKQEKAGTYIR